jgi:hypothetical protein
MAITRVAYGAFNIVFNAANQPSPPAFLAGDCLLLITGEFIGSDLLTTPAGWTLLSANSAVKQCGIYGLISATGSETMPSLSWGNQFSWAIVAVYRGVDPTLTLQGFGDRQVNATTNITGPAGTITPGTNGCLVVFAGNKNKTTTSNGVTFSAPANFTMQAQQAANGTRSAVAICDWIQTTATIIPANTVMSGSVGDGTTQTTEGTIIVLGPATAPPPASINVGFVPQPGSPALSSPRNMLQFDGASGISVAPAVPAPISGILASNSTLYSPISIFAPLSVGFVPTPGPGIGPFSNGQFDTFTWATSNPSPTTASMVGVVSSSSVLYLGTGPTAGQLNGIIPIHSTVYGTATGLLAGSMTGILASQSVTFGGVNGTLDMSFALSQSNSTVSTLQAGSGNFQPLVPFTAVVDVRLNIGYQPWNVRPVGTIG